MKAIRSMVLVTGDEESMKHGALDVFNAIQKQLATFGLEEEITVSMVNDVSKPGLDPLVLVYPDAVIYGSVTPEDIPHLVEEHLYKGRVVEEKQISPYDLTGRVAWLTARKGTLPAEHRIVLKNVGLIDPENIDEYILINEGYEALGKVLREMTPQETIAETQSFRLARPRRRRLPHWPQMVSSWPA